MTPARPRRRRLLLAAGALMIAGLAARLFDGHPGVRDGTFFLDPAPADGMARADSPRTSDSVGDLARILSWTGLALLGCWLVLLALDLRRDRPSRTRTQV